MTAATVKIAAVSNHPNRGSNRANKAGANPTPAQVKRAREAAGLTLEQAGALVYSGWRSWQNWEADVGSAEHRRMHAATWELFRAKVKALELIKKGELAPSTVRELELYLPDPG